MFAKERAQTYQYDNQHQNRSKKENECPDANAHGAVGVDRREDSVTNG